MRVSNRRTRVWCVWRCE